MKTPGLKRTIEFFSKRSTAVFFSFTLQLAVLLAVLIAFSEFFFLFSAASLLLSFIVIIWILNDSKNSAFKIAWIILILIFPIFGGIFYLLFGRTRLAKKMRERLDIAASAVSKPIRDNKKILEVLNNRDPDAALQANYILATSYTTVSMTSVTEYYSSGETAFAAILEELRYAQQYIFLEFFIIAEGRMWASILDILTQKAKEGLDVRVLYDDFGCMRRLPRDYSRVLEKKGIKTAIFNPLKPILSSTHNHRDHRKILVIDGTTAFTGGINLADEYINELERFGYWKDNAVKIKGDAVDNFVRMFLELWNYARPSQSNLPARFKTTGTMNLQGDGYIIAYEDNPLDEESVGINVYLNLISRSKRYLFITTPYLIIDESLSGALCLAAKSGVDVRIITPGVPDKWYVHAVTRANYPTLLKAGVKIFEYSPGFIHCKTFVADDRFGLIGTINLDFRSFYLHFECGVWLYNTQSIHALRDDFMATLEKCREMKLSDLAERPIAPKVQGWLLRVFSPLL